MSEVGITREIGMLYLDNNQQTLFSIKKTKKPNCIILFVFFVSIIDEI